MYKLYIVCKLIEILALRCLTFMSESEQGKEKVPLLDDDEDHDINHRMMTPMMMIMLITMMMIKMICL